MSHPPRGVSNHAITQILLHFRAVTHVFSHLHAIVHTGQNFPLSRNHAHIFSDITQYRKSERVFHAVTHTKKTFHASRTHVSFTQSRNYFLIFTQSRNKKGSFTQSRKPMGGLTKTHAFFVIIVFWTCKTSLEQVPYKRPPIGLRDCVNGPFLLRDYA